MLLAAYGPCSPAIWEALTSELRKVVGALQEWKHHRGQVSLASASAGIGSGEEAMGEVAAVGSGYVRDQFGAGVRTADASLGTYKRGGVEALASMRGDYSFALWDGSSQSLLLGCDAVGLRAPAYLWDGTVFLACSTALPLLRHPTARRSWDAIYIAHALSGFWGRSPAATAFHGIHRMRPGQILRVSRDGLDREDAQALSFGERRTTNRHEAVSELSSRIDRAVDIAWGSAGPACVALSGGIDSLVVASSVARHAPPLAGLTLISSQNPDSEARTALHALRAAFPRMEWRPVEVDVASAAGAYDDLPPPDDPVASAPGLQPARRELLRTAHNLGFRSVFDGEGGDEVFDIAWSPADLAVERSWAALLKFALPASSRARLRRDLFAQGALGPLSLEWLDRHRAQLPQRIPWLKPSFWESEAFGAVWEEAIDYARKRRARNRLPAILGSLGRYWRAQEVLRQRFGLLGASPLLDRDVIEFAASLPTRVAIDATYPKILLRRVAAARAPADLWKRPKREPLYERIARQTLSDSERRENVVRKVLSSPILSENLDAEAVKRVAAQLSAGSLSPLANGLADLFSFVEWTAALEEGYGLS